MKSILIATFIALTSASKADFPKFDTFHADCSLTTNIEGTCDEVYAALSKTVKTMADPAQGTYKVQEEGANDYVWATRTTPIKKYVDDILFTVHPFSYSNGTCAVSA